MLGKPDMTVIAFASKEVNIYKVNSAMAEKGWSLNALHKPERYISYQISIWRYQIKVHLIYFIHS